MNISELIPPAQKHTSFELYNLNRIADGSGCYCLTNAAGDILYIGQAVSLRDRLIQHFDSSKRSALTPYGRISKAWWRAEDSIRLSALERGWLEAATLRDGQFPPLNRMSAPF